MFEKLNSDDLLEKMKKSMDLDLIQEREIISKINNEYRPDQISLTMANKIRGGVI